MFWISSKTHTHSFLLLFLEFYLFSLICMNALLACVIEHHAGAWYRHNSELTIRFLWNWGYRCS